MKEDDTASVPISVDSLLFFLLLIPHYFRFPELTVTAFPHGLWTWLDPFVPEPTSSLPNPANLMAASLLMLLLVAYLFTDAAGRMAGGAGRLTHRLKLAMVLTAFTLIILIPALHEISLRQIVGPETHAHDGVVAVEEAIKMTLQGRNPYTEHFYGTPVEKTTFANPQAWQRLGIGKYPALEKFVYLPMTFLIPLPLYVVTTKLAGGFDLRLLLIPMYLFFIWFSYKMSVKDRKIIAVQFAALNPFLATFLITGRNDIMPLSLMAASIVLLQRRPLAAQFFLALACLTKQYVWLTVPFFGLCLIRGKDIKGLLSSAAASIWVLWPFWVMFLIGMLPFFLLNPTAFVKGVLLDSQGLPIKGIGAYGFGTWVLYFGWVKGAADRFPFLAVQILTTVPALLLCFYWQMKRNHLSQLFLGSSLVLFVFFYFSRYFHDNYVGVITALLALAFCAAPEKEGAGPPEQWRESAGLLEGRHSGSTAE